MLLAARTTEA